MIVEYIMLKNFKSTFKPSQHLLIDLLYILNHLYTGEISTEYTSDTITNGKSQDKINIKSINRKGKDRKGE